MVAETLFRVIVHTEAFVPGVVVVPDAAAGPALVTFDAEVIVALLGQAGLSGAGFQDTLCKGNAGRHAAAQHLLHSNFGIFFYILFLQILGAGEKGNQRGKSQ